MKRLRKSLSLIMILIILFSSATSSWASSSKVNIQFKDIKPTSWYTETVAKLVKLGIIDGYSDGTFRPNNTIKRDEFIKLVVSSMGYKIEPGEVYWARPYIDKAIEIGLITKDEFDDYKVNIRREEMSSIIVNAALKTTDTVSNANSYDHLKRNIKDYHLISDKYKQQVLYAYDLGIMSGYDDGTVRPKNNANRAEASAVIMRYLDKSLRTYTKIDMEYVELKEYNTESYWYDSWFLDYMKVYPPVRNGNKYTEFIDVAKVLKDNMDKTKGFGVVGYVSQMGNVSARIFNSTSEEELEEHVNRYPYYGGVDVQDISIYIKTLEWDINGFHRLYPYQINIYNAENYNAHSEVVEAVFKELFGKYSAKAISELNSIVKKANYGSKVEKEFTFNNRKLVIENLQNNRVDIYVSTKLK